MKLFSEDSIEEDESSTEETTDDGIGFYNIKSKEIWDEKESPHLELESAESVESSKSFEAYEINRWEESSEGMESDEWKQFPISQSKTYI